MVSSTQSVEVVGFDDLFGIDGSPVYAREDDIGRGIEIDDEIGATNVVAE